MHSVMQLRSVLRFSVLITIAVASVNGTYTLHVEVFSYNNPEHRDFEGACCDIALFSCGACESDFRFCVRSHGTSVTVDSCPTLPVYYTANHIPDSPSSYNFNLQGELYPGANVNNPLVFTGSSWPTNYQFYVRIDDVDSNADDLIDRIVFDFSRSPNGQWSSYVQRTGVYGQATMQARFRVFCDANFYGSSCTTFCQPTDSSSGHYTCDVNGQIVCNSGYSDPSNNCITPICSPGCSSINGYCNVPNECRCNDGWSGANCDQCIKLPGCSADHGSCTVANECICDEGYTGEFCTMDSDVCGHQQPCAVGSTCTNTGPDQYLCFCPAGFTGQNCTIDINECSPNPCLNGATCLDQINAFECQCDVGWTGDTCGVNIDDCDPDPCLNGAICLDQINMFECQCDGGWTGDTCEVNIDDCDPDPCLNGATCSDLVDGYNCSCAEGYLGKQCEGHHCDTSPCLNNATCVAHTSGYECTCPDAFTGTNCEMTISACQTRNPCADGLECVDEVDGNFYCQLCIEGVCRVVDSDFVAGASPSPSSNTEPATDFLLVGVAVGGLLVLLVLGCCIVLVCCAICKARRRPKSQDAMQYINSSNGSLKVSENPMYLPVDLIASPTSTLRSTVDEDGPAPGEVNNPAYTGVTFHSPTIGNSTYDTLSGSQNNLLENEDKPDQNNLYTLDPTNPYQNTGFVNIDSVSSEKKTFPQICDEENPYESIPGNGSNTPYENIPAPPGSQTLSGVNPYAKPFNDARTHSKTIPYQDMTGNTSEGVYDFIQ